MLERQNYEMYSSSVKRTELLEKENNSTIKDAKAKINSLNKEVSAQID